MERFLGKTPTKRAPSESARVDQTQPEETAAGPAVPSPTILTGATAEDTKRLRADRAQIIRELPLEDFEKNKVALMEELKTLKGVEPGWCNEAAGIMRTKDGNICEVNKIGLKDKRAVAWTYVIAILGAAAHAVICLICFAQVFVLVICSFTVTLIAAT